jgi:prepilin-type N-terminal cleavage/methylation domain-containing protein
MNRRGVTLIELMITMTILAVIASVTVLAVRRFDPVDPTNPRQMVADSSRAAMATSRTITMRLLVGSVVASVTVRPDGSILADSAFAIERLSGAPINAR